MNKILVLNGSPRKDGVIHTLLKEIAKSAKENNEIEWIDVYDLQMKPCIGCILSKDDAHIVGGKIEKAHALIIGTPTYWGNMSSQLKVLFERNVPIFMGEKPNGIPLAKQKGKKAAIVVSCSTLWPFNFIANESRGAVNAVKEVLHYGGYKIIGKIIKPGTKMDNNISEKTLKKAKQIGSRF